MSILKTFLYGVWRTFLLAFPSELLDHLLKGKRGLIYLMYHSVDDLYSKEYGFSVDRKSFELHLSYLFDRNLIINFTDSLRYLSGKDSPESLKVVITFDDGYIDNYLYAYPILKRYQCEAIFFITTEFIASYKSSFMNWEHVREMSSAGMSFGSHTIRHFDLRVLNQKDVIEEIKKSKSDIEANLEKNIYAFSYPFGSDSDWAYEVAKETYTFAFIDRSLKGVQRDQARIPRMNVGSEHNSLKRFKVDLLLAKVV